jgi:hypothetical protein
MKLPNVTPQKLLGPNTFPIVMIGGLFVMVALAPMLPNDLGRYLVVIFLILLLGGFATNNMIQQYIPKNYLHMDAIFRNAEGRAGRVQQIFLPPDADDLTIEHFDAKEFKFDAKDINGNPIIRDGKAVQKTIKEERPFILRPEVPIDIGPFVGIKAFMVIPPNKMSFDECYKLGPRPKVAMFRESEIYTDHPFSDHVTYYVEGLYTHLDIKMPVVRLIESGGRWDEWHSNDEKEKDGCSWAECAAGGMVALNTAYALKTRDLVRSDQKVEVLDSEVEGFQNEAIDVHKSVARTVDALHEREGSIDNVWKLLHNREQSYILLIIAIIGILGILYYLNNNPDAGQWVQYYIAMYWWVILIVLGIVGYLLYRRMIRRH